MELATETEPISSLGFPTATPILDVLRPLPDEQPARLTVGDYFFVSSAIILAFTELPVIRQFLDAISAGSLFAFWTSLFLAPLAAIVSAAAVHLAGHLCAGRLAGFEIVKIKIGRVTLRDKLESNDVLSLGSLVMRPLHPSTRKNKNGACWGPRPRSGEQLSLRLAGLILGGPLASLLTPLLLEGGLRLVRSYATGGSFLISATIHLFSAVSLLAGIGSLLPDMDSSGNFSDGTRLLMLLKHDFRGARMLAMIELQLRLRSGEPSRSSGEDITRAVAPQDESFDTVAANWLAYLCASARQEVGPAAKFLETALATLGSSPGHLRDRIFLEAAAFQAWYRHNHVKAKFWESQITHLNSLPLLDRKRLEIACCWAEGKLFDAWEKLGEYLRWLRALPPSNAIQLAESDALEWKTQMESRMLSGAWATMHSWPYSRQVTDRLQVTGHRLQGSGYSIGSSEETAQSVGF